MTELPVMPDVLTLAEGDITVLTQRLSTFLEDRTDGLAVLDVRDITSGQNNLTTRNVTRWERALRGLERSPATTVALLGGRAQGHALEVALACDIRIASPASTISWHAEGGIWPSMALYRMVQFLGLGATRRFLLLDGSWDANRALSAGLVDRVADVPWTAVEELRSGVQNIDDFRIVRQLLAEAASTSYDDALGAHLAACDRFKRRRTAS